MTFAAVYLETLGLHYRDRRLSYKPEAIQAIIANLQRPDSAISNSNIGAVAMLASAEVSLRSLVHSSENLDEPWQGIGGNHEQLRIHMQGLHRMVNLRGGLSKLAYDKSLQ